MTCVAKGENAEEENGDRIVRRVLFGDDAGPRKSSRTKGGRISINTGQILRKYLPTACAQFMTSI